MFKRKKTDQLPAQQPNEIKKLINVGLRRLSEKLSRREQRMTLRQKKWAITGFCLASGFISMTILYHGLFAPASRPPSYLHYPSISRPVSPHLPDSLLHYPGRNLRREKPENNPNPNSFTK